MAISSLGLDMSHTKFNILKYLQILLHMHALFYVTHDIERTSNDNIDMVVAFLQFLQFYLSFRGANSFCF